MMLDHRLELTKYILSLDKLRAYDVFLNFAFLFNLLASIPVKWKKNRQKVTLASYQKTNDVTSKQTRRRRIYIVVLICCIMGGLQHFGVLSVACALSLLSGLLNKSHPKVF